MQNKADTTMGPQQGSENWHEGTDPMRRMEHPPEAVKQEDGGDAPIVPVQSVDGQAGSIPWGSTVTQDQPRSGFSHD